MPKSSESINNSLFDLLRSKGYNPTMLDTAGKEIPVPDEAEVFQFDFIKDEVNYGTVTISIDGLQKLTIYYNDSVANSKKHDNDETTGSSWYSLLKQLKKFAKSRQLGFELKNSNHLKHDMAKRDFMKHKNKISEGYYPMGKKASYSDSVPNVKIVIEHTRQIEEGEQRYRNINRIFLENQLGERFLLDTKKPGIARVYARHIAEGGKVNDERWGHINNLCEEYQKMAGFVRATRNGQFNESAQKLVNEGINHYQSLRETLSRMTGHRGYNMYFESWTPALMEDETDTNAINELFVQETLDPRIESVMPILSKLHKQVAEMKEVSELSEWADSLLEGGDGGEASEESISTEPVDELPAGGNDAPEDNLDEGTEPTLDDVLARHSDAVEAFRQGGDMDYDLESDLWDYYFTSGDIKNYDADASEFLSQKLADHLGIDESLDESGLQAYLGNKKYGKEGMDALRKAGREHAGKEKMAKIRAKYDKLDEEGMMKSFFVILDDSLIDQISNMDGAEVDPDSGTVETWNENTAKQLSVFAQKNPTRLQRKQSMNTAGMRPMAQRVGGSNTGPEYGLKEEGLGNVVKKVGGALKSAGKKVIDVISPDDEQQLIDLRYRAGLSNPEHGKPNMAKPNKESTEDQMDEGWKDKLAAVGLAGAMAMGASGANARVSYDADGNKVGGFKPVPTQQAGGSSQELNIVDNISKDSDGSYTITHNNKEYQVKIVPKNMEAVPRSATKVKVTQAQMGVRGIGTYVAYLLPNGTAFLLSGQPTNEEAVAEGTRKGDSVILKGCEFEDVVAWLIKNVGPVTKKSPNYYNGWEGRGWILHPLQSSNEDGIPDLELSADTKLMNNRVLAKNIQMACAGQQGVAEGNDKNVVVKFSASEYAAMSPEQKAAKQQEWQTLKQQAKRQLKNFTIVDTDKDQGVAEGGFNPKERAKAQMMKMYGDGQITFSKTSNGGYFIQHEDDFGDTNSHQYDPKTGKVDFRGSISSTYYGEGVTEGDYPDGSSIKTPDAAEWKQQYQQAVMAVKNAKTQQEYEAASERAGRIKDLLASKGIQVGPVLGQQGVAEDLDANQKRVGQLGPTEKVKNNNIGKLVGANESVEQLGELKKSTVKSYADKKQAELDDVPPMPFKKPGMSKAEHEKAAKGMTGALARLSGKKPTSESVKEGQEDLDAILRIVRK